MTRPRKSLRWSPLPPRPVPKHPYRDTLLMYGAFAVILVLIAWASGTSIGRAIAIALVVFVGASGWSVLGWRRRLREQGRFEDLER